MNEILEFLRPTTLVAIIVDLQEAIPNDPSHINALWNVNLAVHALVNLVGSEETSRMIQAAVAEVE